MIENEAAIPEEQRWRADTFNLLANLLYAPPDDDLLERLAGLRFEEEDPTQTSMTAAWKELSLAARHSESESVRNEYHRLFIGMNRGEILPYGSWYLTGFLMEKPLARLRGELAKLGIERHEKVREPEDHIAALFEVMALLIRRDDANQQGFFDRHIGTWAPRLFMDIANAPHSDFYIPVARLALEFIGLEKKLVDLKE